jgi:hypothetical protein
MGKLILTESDQTYIKSLYGLLSESNLNISLADGGKVTINNNTYSMSFKKGGIELTPEISNVVKTGNDYKIIGKVKTIDNKSNPFEVDIKTNQTQIINKELQQNNSSFNITSVYIGEKPYGVWMKKIKSASPQQQNGGGDSKKIKCPSGYQPFDMGKFRESNYFYCKTDLNSIAKYAGNGYPYAEYVNENGAWVVYYDTAEKEGSSFDVGPVKLSKGLNDYLNSKISQ